MAKISDKQVMEALVKAAGIPAHAAKSLGVHRSTVTRRVNGSPKLKAFVEELQENTHDLVESKLMKAIDKGDLRAIIFYLETRAKDRGWSKKVILGAMAPIPVQVVPADYAVA